jgi:hypothetical protein
MHPTARQRQHGRWHLKETAVRSLHPVFPSPDPGATASRAARRRFLGEELTTDPLAGSSWLVKAVLGGAPPLEITRDGVIPPRPSGVLPLRHGLSRAGLPASCLLSTPGLARLRANAAGADESVECAACRAWQKLHGIAPRPAPSHVMARLRAALGEVFTKAA